MYQINSNSKSISPLQAKRFNELGFREREDLQEWLVSYPEALGEELLILQKEFDGFDETRERLDLLALDKQGGLVIIENKLDDSGKDVVWQSLKYASYCSSLSKSNIGDIYQDYLNRYCGGGNARESICEFLEAEEFSDVVLNLGNDQRVILVAANFRREVTSTVLWLLQNGLQIQCFKATPYQLKEDIYLTLDQIIPTPEAAEFMVGISDKEKEQKSTVRAKAQCHSLRRDFWTECIESLKCAGITRYQNISPSDAHWLSAGSGMSGVWYSMIFSRKEARMELAMRRATKEESKRVFDLLIDQKDMIEEKLGTPIEWRRLDDKKVSLIVSQKDFDGFNKDSWAAMIEWLVEQVSKFDSVFSTVLPEINKTIKGK